MSLINEMLKDLEKRRSRDLETSKSLSQNITWETRPNQKRFNWLVILTALTLVTMLGVISYLLWERTMQNTQLAEAEIKKTAAVKKVRKPVVKQVKRKVKKQIIEKAVVENNYDDAIDIEKESEDVVSSTPLKLKKKHRPLK